MICMKSWHAFAKTNTHFYHSILKADDRWTHDDAIVFFLHPNDQNKWLEMDEGSRKKEYHEW